MNKNLADYWGVSERAMFGPEKRAISRICTMFSTFHSHFFTINFFVKKNLRYLPLSAACNIWTRPIYFVLMFLSTRLLSGFRIQSRQNEPWFLLPYTLFDRAFLFHLNWIQAVVSDKRCGSDSYGVHTWLHLHQAKDRCSRVQSLSRGPANFYLKFLSTVRVLEV